MDVDRQTRIAPPRVEPMASSPAQDNYAPTFPRVPGVIVSLDVSNFVIRWRRVRYKRGRPTRGMIEAYGPIEDGFPLEGAWVEDYEPLAWGNEPPDENTGLIFAVHRGGYWILDRVAKAQRLIVVSANFPDTVLCKPSASSPLRFHVAKPYLLRRTPFHGRTRDGIIFLYSSNTQRTAQRALPPGETQIIIPKYIVDDVLIAIPGAIDAQADDLRLTPGGEAVRTTLLDVNVDGRYWAKV